MIATSALHSDLGTENTWYGLTANVSLGISKLFLISHLQKQKVNTHKFILNIA